MRPDEPTDSGLRRIVGLRNDKSAGSGFGPRSDPEGVPPRDGAHQKSGKIRSLSRFCSRSSLSPTGS